MTPSDDDCSDSVNVGNIIVSPPNRSAKTFAECSNVGVESATTAGAAAAAAAAAAVPAPPTPLLLSLLMLMLLPGDDNNNE